MSLPPPLAPTVEYPWRTILFQVAVMFAFGGGVSYSLWEWGGANAAAVILIFPTLSILAGLAVMRAK